ncbi:hypothetical protein [uncultured Tateyamaria sp.]|uniref:hypothetical protein n=1 Tax=uncultured Tateyamaria sp. TaxID=455651 RepID=UPI00260EBE09|nr:hypothetical protein [uncultured Tateyamaria sp.]
MDSFYLLATAILFGLSLYTLARADGWGKAASIGLAICVFALPAFILILFFRFGVSGFVAQTLLGVASIGVMVVLFALAKSVANRLRTKDDV